MGNIAMCWLKITDAENNLVQAIRSCDDALAIDPDSVKALFRRATAREQKGMYEEAKADLIRCAELAPDDKAVPKLMSASTRRSQGRRRRRRRCMGRCSDRRTSKSIGRCRLRRRIGADRGTDSTRTAPMEDVVLVRASQ